MSVRDDYQGGNFSATSSSGFPGQKKAASIRDSYSFNQDAVNARLKQEQDDLVKKQQDKQKQDAKQKLDEQNSPLGMFKRAAGVVSDFTAGMNEKILGGVVKSAVKGVNDIATGFNQKEADKRTNDFLKTTKQANAQSQAPLASGAGVNRNSTSFQTGGATGDIVRPFVDPVTDIAKGARNVIRQSAIGTNNQNVTPEFVKNQTDFLNSQVKAGKISQKDANAKLSSLQAKAKDQATKIASAEEKVGTKYDQSSGAVDLLNTVANTAGLGTVAKTVYNKVVSAATAKLGRSLTEKEAMNLAEQTKKAIPEKPNTTVATPVEEPLMPQAEPVTMPVKTADRPVVTAPVAEPHPLQEPIFQAAKVQAEKRLGRDLKPEELQKLTNDTQKVVSEKMPVSEQPVPTPINSKKELSTAVDAHLFDTRPDLFHTQETGRVFSEGGTKDIPAMHVDDVKKYFGSAEDVPAIYKRTTGEKDIDKLAQRAGYDDVDQFASDIMDELGARSHSRNASKELAQLRKDPEVIARATANLEKEKAQYGTPDTFEPSSKDIKESTQVLHGDSAKPIKNKPSLTVDEIDPQIKGNRNVKGDTASGNSVRLEQNALEKKLTDNFGDLASYKSINMKEQAEKATKLINEDRQKAIDIIDGKTNPPGNLKEQSVHQALEDAAVREGDVDLLQKLAKSHVNTELSESAQNLRIAAERDPTSAVENIRQIQETRRAAAEKRTGTTVSKVKENIKKTVDANTPKVEKETWASFVESLKC